MHIFFYEVISGLLFWSFKANCFFPASVRERLQLERDKSQMDADLKIRQSEVSVLQKELDSLNGTLAQLDSQKREAQKRLDELNDKVCC